MWGYLLQSQICVMPSGLLRLRLAYFRIGLGLCVKLIWLETSLLDISPVQPSLFSPIIECPEPQQTVEFLN